MNPSTTICAIFLTKTDTQAVFDMTVDAIKSLQVAADQLLQLKVIVVESGNTAGKFQFPDDVKVMSPDEPFNFHRFFNLAASSQNADWYFFCNNDVLFDPQCIENLMTDATLHTDIGCWSVRCPNSQKQTQLIKQCADQTVVPGYTIGAHFSGWGFLVRAQDYIEMGGLDETFYFYFADNDFAMMLRKYNVTNALSINSKVAHLEHKKVSKESKDYGVLLNEKRPWITRFERFRYIGRSDAMIKGYHLMQRKWGNWLLLSFKSKVFDFLKFKLKVNPMHKFLF